MFDFAFNRILYILNVIILEFIMYQINKRPFIVSFFGHRYVTNFVEVECKLEKILEDLFRKQTMIELLVGRDGEFDQMVSSSIKRAKNQFCDSYCTHTWVLPYPTAELRDNEDSFYDYYDSIEIASNLTGYTHPKAAFQARNRMMVDRSDLVVFYVEHQKGGAYQTYQYALKHGKQIINIAESLD